MKKLFILIAAGFLMVACSEDVTTSRSDGDKQNITFSVTYDDAISVQIQNASTRAVAPWTLKQISQPATMAQVVAVETDFPSEEPLCLTIIEEPFIRRTHTNTYTRGALLNSSDAAALSFGVTEYPTGGTVIGNAKWENSHPSYEGNISAGLELFKAIQKWESDAYTGTQYDFYAYAPWEDAGTGQGITLSENRQAITYDPTGVPANNQPDLMTARKATSAYVGAVPLNFQHRLCAVQIKTDGAWDTDYEVSGIQFQNIYYYGSFDIDTDKDADWNSYNGGTPGNPGPKGNYTATGFETGVAAVNAVVAGETSTWLMMIPQSLSGAKLSVTLRHKTSGKTYTMTAPINNSIWHAGYTVTYTVGPEQITSMYVSYPLGNRAWSGSENGLVTEYAANEEFGLFVVDKDGNVIVSNATAKASADGAEPTLTLPTGVFFSKQYKYFLMYPKKTDDQLVTLLGGNIGKLTTSNSAATAEAFFSELITAWSPATDQSDIDKWKAQDLQVAMFDGTKFPMAHKMGLVKISLGTKTIPTTRTYSSGGASGPDPITGMKYTDSGETQTVTASSQFDDSCIPLNSSGYFYIVNGSKTLKSVSTVNTDWERELTGIVAGSYNAITIQDADIKRTCYKFTALFPYTGAVQEFPLPVKGTMTMQCWGAEGGGFVSSLSTSYSGKGGYGGYAKGDILLSKGITCYVYVGGRPLDFTGVAGGDWRYGGWNGGGDQYGGGGGGGATDIRFVTCSTASTWNELSSLRSRIIVAGGGGGWDTNSTGGYGGGFTGGTATNCSNPGTGGTQTTGGTGRLTGNFGQGGMDITADGGGAGGGWYGGGSGNDNVSGGGGGSGFISGHPYCNGVNSSGTHLGASTPSQIRFPGTESDVTVSFTSGTTVMIDGGGCEWTTNTRGSQRAMPNPAGGNYASGIGHSGPGYAKITMITPDND